VRVFKAGHMVPMDQPEAASDLIQTITKPGAWE
jgi:carboxypeptidase C (cathepsin A)